jgi:cell division septum initiation protein DivIVA
MEGIIVMADKNVLFRTSMGGFNKADVMAYLDKQNADFRELAKQKDDALAAKDAEIASLRAQLDDMINRANEAGAEEKTSEEAEELKAKLQAAEAALAEKDAEIEKLKGDSEKASSENERKAGLYDDMSSQIGDILLTANKNADTIIAEANAKAAEINEKAVEDAEERRRCFEARMSRISAAVRNNTAAAADNFRGDVKAELEIMRKLLEDTVKSVDEKSAAFTELADKLEKRLNAEIDSAVSEIEKETETLKGN